MASTVHGKLPPRYIVCKAANSIFHTENGKLVLLMGKSINIQDGGDKVPDHSRAVQQNNNLKLR